LKKSAKAAGVQIVANHDADRIQIFFDQIPDAAKRDAMKRQGWKWSPKNQAWQRRAINRRMTGEAPPLPCSTFRRRATRARLFRFTSRKRSLQLWRFARATPPSTDPASLQRRAA
jgi:hypothetical protein